MANSSKLKKTSRDHALSALKAAVSIAPILGSPLASLIGDYIPTTYDKRKEELLLQLDEDFKRLESRFNEETLTKDYFITTFSSAFSKALQTHQEEKVKAFRAIVLNTLISQTPNEDEIAMFLGLTERLTPLHLKLLKIFHSPEAAVASNPEAEARVSSIHMGGLSTLTSSLLPQYDQGLVELAFRDLYNMGLHRTDSFTGTMTRHGILQKRTSEFADRYMAFITLPPEIGDER